MDRVIKVAICDDAKYLCEGFKAQFELFSEVEMVGMAHDSESCMQMLAGANPDILLLDIRMETEDAGVRLIPEIKDSFPDIKILMLTSFDDDAYVFEAFANGADDYCKKTVAIEHLIQKVRNIMDDKIVLDGDIAKKLVNQTHKMKKQQLSLLYIYNKVARLSAGEYELLRELYYGANYRIIARKKCVEVESVEKMAKRLLKRMENKTMKELLEEMRALRVFEFIDSAQKE